MAAPMPLNAAAIALPTAAGGWSPRCRQLTQTSTGRKTSVGTTPIARAPSPDPGSSPKNWPACISIWAP